MTDEAVFHEKLCAKCHENYCVLGQRYCAECKRIYMQNWRIEQASKRAADKTKLMKLENILARLRRAHGRAPKKLSKGKDNESGNDTVGHMPAASSG